MTSMWKIYSLWKCLSFLNWVWCWISRIFIIMIWTITIWFRQSTYQTSWLLMNTDRDRNIGMGREWNVVKIYQNLNRPVYNSYRNTKKDIVSHWKINHMVSLFVQKIKNWKKYNSYIDYWNNRFWKWVWILKQI